MMRKEDKLAKILATELNIPFELALWTVREDLGRETMEVENDTAQRR